MGSQISGGLIHFIIAISSSTQSQILKLFELTGQLTIYPSKTDRQVENTNK